MIKDEKKESKKTSSIHNLNTNDIENLISRFDDYLNKVKNGFKISKFFKEFDDQFGRDLKLLVKLSHERYKSVKSGNSVYNAFDKQKKELVKLIDSALNDPFYKTAEIFDEKKKLKNMIDKKANSELNLLRNKIRDNKPKSNNQILGSKLKNQSPKKENSERKKDILPVKGDHEKYLKEDMLYLTQMFSEYKNYISMKKEPGKIKEEDIKKNKFDLNINNLKYISSKLIPTQQIVTKKKKNEEIDMQKLISIQKDQNNIHRQRLQKKEDFSDHDILFNSDLLTENNPFNIIKEEIFRTKNFTNKIKSQSARIEKMFKSKKLFVVSKGSNQNRSSTPVAKTKELNNQQDQKDKKEDMMFKEYRDNYKIKKEKWNNEDNLVAIENKKDSQNKQIRKKFMNEVSNLPIKAQIYIDDYSIRHGEVNNNIIEINRIMRREKMDKSKVNKKIDEILVELDKRKQVGSKSEKQLVNQSDTVKEQMRKNLETLPIIEESFNGNEILMNSKRHMSKQPIRINGQTATDEFNMFKQYQERILEKKEENIGIKPMTAGQFLNETKPKNETNVKIVKNPNLDGLQKLFEKESKEIVNILKIQNEEQQRVVKRVNEIRKTVERENNLFGFEANKSEKYFAKKNHHNISRTQNEFYKIPKIN